MRIHEKSPLLSEGHALLGRLFATAESRLRERGILMRSSPAVLEWLLDRTDWRVCPNPIRTLDGYWSRQMAAPIETLLLEGRLRSGNILEILVAETPTGPQIQFDITGSV